MKKLNFLTLLDASDRLYDDDLLATFGEYEPVGKKIKSLKDLDKLE